MRGRNFFHFNVWKYENKQKLCQHEQQRRATLAFFNGDTKENLCDSASPSFSGTKENM